eukprot:m.123283 g.123283  ORF g.123283 m.123283 type:complete len:208 (-) comp13749_c0_seq2:350-973(-)
MQQVLQTIVNPIKLSHYDLLTTYSSCPQPHKSSQSLRHLPHSHFFFCTTLAVRFRLDEDAMTDLAIQRHAIKAMQPPPPPVSFDTDGHRQLYVHHDTTAHEASAMITSGFDQLGNNGLFLLRAKHEELHLGQYILDLGWKDAGSGVLVITHHIITKNVAGHHIIDDTHYGEFSLVDQLITFLHEHNTHLPSRLTAFIPAPEVAEKLS